MPRRPRVHAPGSYHHLTIQGVAERPLFADDDDRRRFLGLLSDVTREVRWRCLSFCLMTTHYHLLVQAGDTPVSKGMQLLNGGYANAVNARHGRRGHLFAGRFSDTAVEGDRHLLAAVVYIARNPCEAGLCRSPAEWPWSSYAALVGAARPWSFVSSAWLLSRWAPERDRAIARLRELAEPGV
jgi:REP element-mobilizing transposase RayT